jgi:hypothetical protein
MKKTVMQNFKGEEETEHKLTEDFEIHYDCRYLKKQGLIPLL